MIRGDTPELLNPLAAEYFADQQLDKAQQLLELSLEIDPEQAEMQRLLDEVLRQVQQ
jgi:Tfp pilus assembly protein PilF